MPDLRQVFDDAARRAPFYDNAPFNSNAPPPSAPHALYIPEKHPDITLLNEPFHSVITDESPGMAALAASVDHLTLSHEDNSTFAYSNAPHALPQPQSQGSSVWSKHPFSIQQFDQVKIPSSKYRGLSLSRSVPDALNEKSDDSHQKSEYQQQQQQFTQATAQHIYSQDIPFTQQNDASMAAVPSMSSQQPFDSSIYDYQHGWNPVEAQRPPPPPNAWFTSNPNMVHLGLKHQQPSVISSPSNSDSISISSKTIASPVHHPVCFDQSNTGNTQMFPSMFPHFQSVQQNYANPPNSSVQYSGAVDITVDSSKQTPPGLESKVKKNNV